MDTKIIAAVLILSAVIVIGLVSFTGHSAKSAPQTSTIQASAGQNSTNSSKTLFSGTQYFSYSYLVYPGPISQQAQAALAGFNLTSATLQNSSAEVKISLIGTSQAQSIVLKPNYKIYIIETTFGDDGFHFDSSLGDDGFVIVDPNGYVAQ